jgi:tetratricopeptide (TPR) repeat protein
LVLRGWVSTLEGAPQDGIVDIERGLEIWHASGTRMLEPMMTWPRAWALGLLGQHDEALRIVDASLAFVEQTGELWWAPEVYRLRGELLEARDGPESEAVVANYRFAMKLSAEHDAHMMRLRAANNLARLLRRRGQPADGIALLTPIAASICEGRQTGDVVAALAVLDELC